MEKVNIVDADYDGQIDGLVDKLKNDPTFRDYNFEGTALRSLLRVLALHASDMGLSANLTFNERFIKTAEIRGNVGANAVDQGYVPKSKVASRMLTNVLVRDVGSGLEGTVVTLGRKSNFVGVKDGRVFNFTPDNEYVSTVENGQVVFENVTLVQGTWRVQTFDISGSGIKTMEIADPNIDTRHMSVEHRVSGDRTNVETFKQFTSVFDLGAESNVYFLGFNRDALYEVEYGDGVVSKAPDSGVTLVSYLSTKGALGNDITRLSLSTSIAGSADIDIEVLERSSGGGDEESIDSIRQLAPLAFGSRGLAVNDNQAVVVAKEIFPTADVRAWGGENHVPKKQGYVVLSVKPQNRPKLSDFEKEQLQEHFKGRLVGSINLYQVDPEIFYINIFSKVKWNPSLTNLKSSEIENLVSKTVRSWSSNDLEKFGRSFELYTVSKLINDSSGAITSNVTYATYQKHLEDVSNGLYSVQFFKALKRGAVTLEGLSSPATGEFSVIDEEGVLYPLIGGDIQRNLNFGVVDYQTGEIQLSVPQSYSAELVRVTAEPEGFDQDVQVLRNQILVINQIEVSTEVS